jgi:hypothetical protein
VLPSNALFNADYLPLFYGLKITARFINSTYRGKILGPIPSFFLAYRLPQLCRYLGKNQRPRIEIRAWEIINNRKSKGRWTMKVQIKVES